MSLIRWEPYGGLINLQSNINRLFNDVFPGKTAEGDDLSLGMWRPMVDICDTENAIVVTAELPGVKKEDISIEVKDNILTIKGERSVDSEVKEENYYRRERSFGSFQRSFSLPTEVNPESIKAGFKDGVLKIEVPKPEAKKPKQISIDVT
ncbi:MAG: Hsp20/alpha crystallin family protein [Desulfobacterales bacterium]|jgi:HSP20 family protein|nr:Hsp20/alpha crystallin family protein [Desulfobacterales bacterium]MDD3082413.1 Hsp20/alpha crystallin family protein [Desulfobacterales bacterium]MDD3951490.1 Hsp20/alpha crystallin family protein [Desulfobacterales bacterium]MDD4463205.1 Hsp20/alpha crystallin family protein [Desulfobacterales bacterium]MDY0378080.1 Hsp20/alpha crystallin family protein [Desulfobacterales bacterium]